MEGASTHFSHAHTGLTHSREFAGGRASDRTQRASYAPGYFGEEAFLAEAGYRNDPQHIMDPQYGARMEVDFDGHRSGHPGYQYNSDRPNRPYGGVRLLEQPREEVIEREQTREEVRREPKEEVRRESKEEVRREPKAAPKPRTHEYHHHPEPALAFGELDLDSGIGARHHEPGHHEPGFEVHHHADHNEYHREEKPNRPTPQHPHPHHHPYERYEERIHADATLPEFHAKDEVKLPAFSAKAKIEGRHDPLVNAVGRKHTHVPHIDHRPHHDEPESDVVVVETTIWDEPDFVIDKPEIIEIIKGPSAEVKARAEIKAQSPILKPAAYDPKPAVHQVDYKPREPVFTPAQHYIQDEWEITYRHRELARDDCALWAPGGNQLHRYLGTLDGYEFNWEPKCEPFPHSFEGSWTDYELRRNRPVPVENNSLWYSKLRSRDPIDISCGANYEHVAGRVKVPQSGPMYHKHSRSHHDLHRVDWVAVATGQEYGKFDHVKPKDNHRSKVPSTHQRTEQDAYWRKTSSPRYYTAASFV